jgi:hypothetical protein
MALTSREFKQTILIPNLEEFDCEYDKIHRAYNAVAAVDAYAAHIFHEAKENGVDPFSTLSSTPPSGSDDVAFRQALAREHPEFRVLRDLTKANKHARLTRHNPEVTDSGRTSAQWKGWNEARWGEGRYGGVPQVFVTDKDGREHYVETLVRQSLKMLDTVADAMGIQISSD